MSRTDAVFRQFLGLAISSVCLFSANCALSQITPDRTLLNNSSVTINGSVFNITGGTQAGRNLFHSFQQFSVPTGGTAFFNNGLDVQNIFSRVTGGSPSNIDGIIRANSTANLFFLNPNGIVFGKNASLNIGGSFVATTANAIQFGNQGSFSATNPQAPSPLLTIDPSGLLFNQLNQGATITNQSLGGAGVDLIGVSVKGLRVPDGKSLLLVGGDVVLAGGQLNALGGRVELGGLDAPGTIGIQSNNGNDLSLNFPVNVQRANVSLSNGAGVRVNSGGGGDIVVNANNINISSASTLTGGIEQGLGSVSAKAGDITLNATGDIKIDGNEHAIDNSVRPLAKGNGGNIEINTDQLSLTNFAQLYASTYGQGNAGNVIINAAKSVSLDLAAIFDTVGSSNYSQNNLVKGSSGNIEINTDQLSLTNGAQLYASTYGQGNAGNVIINATKSVSVDNGADIFSTVGFSNYSQNNLVKGNSGNIQITTDQLSLSNNAQWRTNTYGSGNAGNVIINATKSVSLDDAGIFSGVGVANNIQNNLIKGNGGNIQITTDQLSLANGAELSANTLGEGNAGNVIINATKTVSLDNKSLILGSVGSVSYPQNNLVKGDSGNIEITTNQLSLTNSSQLLVSTYGKGNAGNIIINALNGVSLDGNGTAVISGVGAVNDLHNDVANGKWGTIKITTDQLSLSNGAQLRTNTFGQSNAGSLEISARSIRLDNGSITAQTNFGNGGDINLTVQDYILLRNGSKISTNAGTAKAGGNGGNITINTPFILAIPKENSDITANAFSGSGGQININARLFGIQPRQQLSDLTNDITAFSQQGVQGEISVAQPQVDLVSGLVAPPIQLSDVTSKFSQLCPNTANPKKKPLGSFTITGKGSIPPNPLQLLSGRNPDIPLANAEDMEEIKNIQAAEQRSKDAQLHKSKKTKEIPSIVEAQGIVQTPDGQIYFVANANHATPSSQPTASPCPSQN